ncbi:MAG: hypothetical protein CV087_21155 [Candidatus Brocadia sp. WS118]|nr:MAG: hypothetical protein CV087_21155 [Candidatus Brocadia sp. WS118]
MGNKANMDPFDKAVTILNKKNLPNLLTVCCISSAFDYFSEFPEKFPYVFPVVNQAKVSLFIKAILYSKSNNHRNDLLKWQDLPKVFNPLIDAGSKLDILEEGDLDIDSRMTKLIAHFACSQMLFTRENIRQRVSLKYSLYHLIPSKYSKYLHERHKRNFVDIPGIMSEALGINLDTYFVIALFLILGYRDKYYKLLDPPDEIKEMMEGLVKHPEKLENAKERYLGSIIDKSDQLTKYFMFQLDQLPMFNKNDLISFLAITSQTISELRTLNNTNPFQRGHISERLCPLERYPIVKVNPWQYIIPDFRYFDLATTELLRWVFQDIYVNNEFNEVMGTVQESFVKEMIETALNEIIVVPERQYTKGGSHYLGPDLLLIENDKLIVIEIKAKHITLDTRLAQDSDYLIRDLEGAISALVKLHNEKIPDLYSGLDIYSDIQSEINKTRDNAPICVSIIGEGVFSLQEFITMYRKAHPDFSLNSISYPFCIIDVLHFCQALDVSKSNKLSLYSILYEYWEIGNTLDPKPHAAEDFQGREIRGQESVLISAWSELTQKSQAVFKTTFEPNKSD